MKKRGELVPRRLISGKYDHNRWEEGIKRIRALPPSLSFCFSHEREREREEESISPRGNPSWRGVNEREREHSLRLMTRSRQREETSDRLSLGKLSARLERVASHPRSLRFSLFFNRSFRVSNAKNLREVSLLAAVESLNPRIRNGPR